VVAQGLTSVFEVCRNNEVLGEITLNIPGQHNVYNALAAITVALELEIPFAVIRAALKTFSGVQRRLQIKGEVGGVMVIDDYGHHPTEIRATLAAMRSAWPRRRLIVMFQPHRYTRTAGLFKEFSTAFHEADVLLLTEIYAASETPIEGVSGSALLQEIKLHGQKNAHFVAEVDALAQAVREMVQPEDIVLTLGAGSIYQAGEELLRKLEQGHAAC
jgi:UDP-N-acetylmuramate--alanine ligase